MLAYNALIDPVAASGLLTLCFALLILLLEVLDASLKLPIIFSQAVNVCKNHVFDLGKIINT